MINIRYVSKKRRQNSRNPNRSILVSPKRKLRADNYLVYGLLFLYFLWTSSNGLGVFLDWSSNANGLIQKVAESFSMGQLHFRELPPTQLLQLSDPYDPSLNDGIRLHDASLYDGKYFAYFSPVVPLLIVLPLFKLFGSYAPDALLTSVFALIIVLVASKIIDLILETIGWKFKKWCHYFTPIFFTFASGLPFILRRSAFYEVVQLSSIAFLFLFVLLTLEYFLSPKKEGLMKILLASLFFSLSLASRPNVAISGLIFLAGLIMLIYVKQQTLFDFSVAYKYFALLLPMIGVTLVLMGWYNYARFGSVTEFGNNFQLAGIHVQKEELSGLKFIPVGVLGYLFTSPKFEWSFPFFSLIPQSVPTAEDLRYFPEPNMGLFGTLFGVFSIALLYNSYKYRSSFVLTGKFSIIQLASPLLAASLVGLLLNVYLIPGSTYRYTLDFLPLYLLATIPLVLNLTQTENSVSGPLANLMKVLAWVSMIHVMAVNFFIGFEGYLNSFMINNPSAYKVFKNIFEFPLLILIQWLEWMN
jgi:hypothetical protein